MPRFRQWVIGMCVGLTCAGIGIGVWQPSPASDDTNKRVDALMTRKLASAQRVLEGLATENFPLLQSESERLHLYSQEASWQVLQTETYRRLSQDFRQAAQQVEDAAKRKNLDAASLGYIKLTIACLECHHHVRQVRNPPVDGAPVDRSAIESRATERPEVGGPTAID